MKLRGIEPTPSPNTMKLIIDESLPSGKNMNFKSDQKEEAPAPLDALLSIEGVKGLYYVADFIALERNAKHDWKVILPKARQIFGEEVTEIHDDQPNNDEDFEEIKVFIQKFRSIPMQIKLVKGENEHRVGLPERFMETVMEAQSASDNVVMERQWIEQSSRYGNVEEVGHEIAEEISAAYDHERLNTLKEQAFEQNSSDRSKKQTSYKVTLDMMEQTDWKDRYAALEQMNPTIDDLPVLQKALLDEKSSIRRLATVYLGMIEDKKVLPYMSQALKDKSVTVRRTAGDCMSDLGFEEAIPVMIESLKDKNKLVRWRAAMYLYEVGDETAIPALKDAKDDPEFEVALQVNMALERIEGGEQAKGSVWKQMTDTIQKGKQ
ncbi:conserved virulence factor C family protein [Pseudalkalibacillus berkeleyi]|uniref:Conserved virulence factor C family protein n=1 Tax=Pseudalkalibacillus berkeleyi TaxID=1069813 RepID=A0ABS9H079_9BACL|nr:conserved virulence factor C family protein [Pseudalkalibacillus berkeleyi]MCF6137309.1 conserved virulence factor C family protein [Pseudalkalibacillus berkeleyi]